MHFSYVLCLYNKISFQNFFCKKCSCANINSDRVGSVDLASKQNIGKDKRKISFLLCHKPTYYYQNKNMVAVWFVQF